MAKLKISVLHKLFSFFVAIGVALSAAAPFAIKVKAEDETSTYKIVDDGCYSVIRGTGTDDDYTDYYVLVNTMNNSDVRGFILRNSEGYGRVMFCSTGDFKVSSLAQNACPASASYSGRVNVFDGVTYYIQYSSYMANGNTSVNQPDLPLVQYAVPANETWDYIAYKFTYGDGAVAPGGGSGDVELLGLKNLRYNTRLVGHGTQGYQNIDEITWDPGRDLGENFLVGGTVQIRAVSGKYAALTYDGLKALSIGDFEIFGNPVVLADNIVATTGSFSVTWQTVFNSLTILSANLKAYQDAAGYWNREGWAYQYRYKLDNSTTTTDYSEWFTVYSFTSASGDSTVGLDNNLVAQPGSDGLYNNVVDSFNDINTINADIANNYNTNNYYYIDNNQYLINPDTTQQNTEQQGTWDQFTYKFHEYHDSEDLLINDMNNAIEDLTPSADLNSNNNFLNAANWVKVQFDRMTLNTPMELIIIFSLTLGFGLLLIGRFK